MCHCFSNAILRFGHKYYTGIIEWVRGYSLFYILWNNLCNTENICSLNVWLEFSGEAPLSCVFILGRILQKWCYFFNWVSISFQLIFRYIVLGISQLYLNFKFIEIKLFLYLLTFFISATMQLYLLFIPNVDYLCLCYSYQSYQRFINFIKLHKEP